MVDVVLTAKTIVCSLGEHAQSVCAAARAGIVRTSELPFWVAAADDPDATVRAHAVRDHTLGFDGEARLVQLVAAGLRALQRDACDREDRGGGVAPELHLAGPDPLRRHKAAELLPEGPERDELIDERASLAAAPPDHGALQAVLARAAAIAGLAAPPRLASFAHEGHTAFATALAHAVAAVQTAEVPLVLVGAVDTLLTGNALRWLAATHRLKTPQSADGLIPGEAAVFFAVEDERRARARDAAVLARILALPEGREPVPFVQGAPSTGIGTVQLLAAAQATAVPTFVVLDHNGETWRAAEWGMAVHRATTQAPDLLREAPWLPAMSFGDTGAASAALGTAMAAHAFARGRAPLPQALVVAGSDDGGRRGILLGDPAAAVPEKQTTRKAR